MQLMTWNKSKLIQEWLTLSMEPRTKETVSQLKHCSTDFNKTFFLDYDGTSDAGIYFIVFISCDIFYK